MYVYDPPNGGAPQPAINLSITHGVRSSLTMQRTGDLALALNDANRDVAPDLAFADVGGHGYAVVRADPTALEVELVCLPRPVERIDRPDGGEVAYRVTHRVVLWRRGAAPRVVKTTSSGSLPLGSVNARDSG